MATNVLDKVAITWKVAEQDEIHSVIFSDEDRQIVIGMMEKLDALIAKSKKASERFAQKTRLIGS